MHRERTQYNNIILRPSGGVFPESSRRTCVYILYILYMYREREVYVRTRCVRLSGHTRPSSSAALFVTRRTRVVGIFFFPVTLFRFVFRLVLFCCACFFFYYYYFCETVKSRYPRPERGKCVLALSGVGTQLYNRTYTRITATPPHRGEYYNCLTHNIILAVFDRKAITTWW